MCWLASAWQQFKSLEAIQGVAYEPFHRALVISLFVVQLSAGARVKNAQTKESRAAAASKKYGNNLLVCRAYALRACLSLIRSPGVSTNTSLWTVLGITAKAGA